MKKLLLLCLLPFLLYPQTQYRFFINNINMPMDNKGVFADTYQIPGGQGGYYNNIPFLYSGGFWLSGYSADTLWANGVATSSLIDNYEPGKVGSDPNDPLNKIYVVDIDDPPFGASWQEWIDAVQLGAEFYDGNNDGVYNPIDLNGNNIWDSNEDRPDIIGDRVAWCVYNDADTGLYTGIPFGRTRQGIEIQQTVFGYKSESSTQLKDVIFIRYKIFNSGLKNSILDSVYFTAWSDPDLGSNYDYDVVGCDTVTNSGYVYNFQPDPAFNQDPAYFINLLQGAPNYSPGVTFIDINSNGYYDEGTDTPLDTAYNYLGPLRGIEIFPGAINNRMSSFMLNTRHEFGYTNEPDSITHMRNFMKGYSYLGSTIDPCTYPSGQVLGGVDCNSVNPHFMFSGDPETSYGWLEIIHWDVRYCVNTGPFTLEENKPVTIIVAYSIGLGSSPKNSVTVGKLQSQFVQQFYRSNFDDNLVSVEDDIANIPSEFILHQNYPNPFNPSTTISWQSPVGSWQTIKLYNALGQEVDTILDEYLEAGFHSKLYPNGINSTLPSGVYFYQIKAGSFIQTKKMILTK